MDIVAKAGIILIVGKTHQGDIGIRDGKMALIGRDLEG